MDLNEMLVFARVAHAGSFTAAAVQLGMPKSTVSRKIAELEKRLGARLLQRTTRSLTLTDAGRTYYDYSARIVGEIEDAERAVASLQAKPRGTLRVTAPVHAAFLGPIVSDYLKRHPEVSLDLLCTERAVDLVEERFDLGIRAGTLADSTLVAKNLGSVVWFLVAQPGYLRRRGRPRVPDDLKRHACLLFGVGIENARLQLENTTGRAVVAVSPRLMVSDMDVLHSVASAGLGIAVLPAFRCVDDLHAGRLERVLADWNAPPTPVQVVYPSTRYVSPKVRTFVDFLQQRMTPSPWEPDPTPRR